MRSFIFLFLLLWIGNIGYAQNWIQLDTVTTEALHSVSFLDSSRGWAVGHWGTVLKTTDGGTTWTVYTTGTENDEYSSSFIDTSNGWTTSVAGIVRRTTDGGASWTPQTTGTSEWLRDIIFLDVNRGWTVGQGGTVLHTINGGTNWTAQPTGVWRNINAVAFTDTLHGWAAGSGIVFKTTNGGAAWNSQTNINWLALYGIAFADTNHGWIVGNTGQILYTNNGGSSWTIQTSGTTTVLNSVAFVDTNNGWAVGNGGTILRTINGGTTWAVQASGTANNLESITFADANHGWAVGTAGTILFYHATPIPQPHSPAPFDLATPAYGTTFDTSLVNLGWFRSSDADADNIPHYDVWLDTLSGFGSPRLQADSIADTTLTINSLMDDHWYYWTIRATDNNTPGRWASDTSMFVMSYRPDPPSDFGLTSPANGAIFHAYPVHLTWQSSRDPDIGAEVYFDVYLDTLETMTTKWFVGETTASERNIAGGLLEDHTYFWTVKALDNNTPGTWADDTLSFRMDIESSAADPAAAVPSDYYFSTNYPNPFNPSTRFEFGLPRDTQVKIAVYDILGREINVLVNEQLPAGKHWIGWDCRDCPSGQYLAVMSAEGFSISRKVTLLK
jgi:photosystem II stability/assembly factor-like uncharacterized protein